MEAHTPRPSSGSSSPVPSSDLSHPAIDAVLATAANLLGMEVVFIGGITEDSFTFERVHATGQWDEIVEGETFPLADSLCSRMLAGGPPATSDAATEPAYADSPAREKLGITSYVGVPVRDQRGSVVAALCAADRKSLPVNAESVEVLGQLASVVAAHLLPLADEGIVIRRSASGGWEVSGESTGDLTSAMVLADLLAAEVSPGARPHRPEQPLDEVGQLRLSVTQLEHALAARVVVEQAIGVLTERQHHTPREAFERLRKVARSRGRKVQNLAREVVMSATDPAVPLPPELAGRR